MDSHIFSDPIRVNPPMDNGAAAGDPLLLLTWKVQVLRRGDAASPVGTLIINEHTLPARRRKGKIVWKLPDRIDAGPPRFGALEQKRLWELFKQQKKERRKKQLASKLDELGEKVEDSLEKLVVVEDGPLASTSSQHGTARPLVVQPPPISNASANGSATSCQWIKRNGNSNIGVPQPQTTNPVLSKTLPLPPGFAPAPKSTNSNTLPGDCAAGATAAPDLTVHSDGPNTICSHQQDAWNGALPTDLPPQKSAKISNTAAVATTTSSISKSSPLRPPPGMGAPPPGIVAPSSSSSSLPTSYFPHATTAPLHSLGAVVAHTFLQSVTTTTTGAGVVVLSPLLDAWLRYYQEHAIQSLLVGSAQAVCTTAAQRQQQWQSLCGGNNSSSSSGSAAAVNVVAAAAVEWECQGWTVQPAGSVALASTATASTVLVVLTGRTRQPLTGWLAYTLTLLLTGNTDPVPPSGAAADDDAAIVVMYSIANAVLTLFALTTTPAVDIQHQNHPTTTSASSSIS